MSRRLASSRASSACEWRTCGERRASIDRGDELVDRPGERGDLQPCRHRRERLRERRAGADRQHDPAQFASQLARSHLRHAPQRVEDPLPRRKAQGEELEHRGQLLLDARDPRRCRATQRVVVERRGREGPSAAAGARERRMPDRARTSSTTATPPAPTPTTAHPSWRARKDAASVLRPAWRRRRSIESDPPIA